VTDSPAEALADLTADEEERTERIIEVLGDAFADLIESDPAAFRRKFRKMAADPFAFYRGSACLFYDDVAHLDDPWVDERTSRVWIQGDLHAENYGTYMDSAGILVFDVNDFDEAYVGHYTWDLQRMAASIAVLGYSKALSDRAVESIVKAYAMAYAEQIRAFTDEDLDRDFRLTLDNTDGTVHEVLSSARLLSRVTMLEQVTEIDGDDRRIADGAGVHRLDDDETAAVLAAYEEYLETIPSEKRQQSVSYSVKDVVGRSGFGIGSAGLPAFSFLVEGRSQALENDVILTMKQGNVAAPSRVVDDDIVGGYFDHHGHRTALSQRALQAHADPWLGWCELGGVGQVVQERSPYVADLDWDVVHEPDEIEALVIHLGHATAKVHCVSDATSDQELVEFQTEDAISEVLGDRAEALADDLAAFASAYGSLVRDDHRRFVDAFRNGQIPGLPED